jgi:hypothetical protein
MEETHVLRDGNFTNHPCHEETYDELLPYNFGGEDEFGPHLLEERRARDGERIVAFSMIIYRNAGAGYNPYFELQHETRTQYPESPDLTEGMQIWDIDSECRRVQDFTMNMEKDVSDMTKQECYEYVKSEFETIFSVVDDVLGRFKRQVVQ